LSHKSEVGERRFLASHYTLTTADELKKTQSLLYQYYTYTGLDWIEQALTSNSTHLGHFGDGGVTAASARIVAAVRVHGVCGVE